MKRTESSEVTARINKFLDRKAAKTISMDGLLDYKSRRSYRNEAVAIDTPFIALAIK